MLWNSGCVLGIQVCGLGLGGCGLVNITVLVICITNILVREKKCTTLDRRVLTRQAWNWKQLLAYYPTPKSPKVCRPCLV